VALTTSEPDALLPYNITNLFIVSPTAWQKQYDAVPASAGDSAARSKQAWTAFAAHAVGSGPFKLEKLVPRQQLILDKNPDYWNKDRIPRVDKVVLIPRRPTPAPRRCCRSRWTGLKPRRRTHRSDQVSGF
jgi:peptide/nickel transport system substrate-binding protein